MNVRCPVFDNKLDSTVSVYSPRPRVTHSSDMRLATATAENTNESLYIEHISWDLRSYGSEVNETKDARACSIARSCERGLRWLLIQRFVKTLYGDICQDKAVYLVATCRVKVKLNIVEYKDICVLYCTQ